MKNITVKKGWASLCCILICLSLFIPGVYAQNAATAARNVAERAVNNAIESTISDTIREINTDNGEMDKISAFFVTPTYSNLNFEFDANFFGDGVSVDTDASTFGALGGFVFGFSEDLYFTVGLSYYETETDMNIFYAGASGSGKMDISMYSINLGAAKVFSRSDTLKIWGSLDGTYSSMEPDFTFAVEGFEVSETIPDIDIYSIGPSITADFTNIQDISILTSLGVKYNDYDTIEEWSTALGVKIKRIAGQFQPSFGIKWDHVFADIGDDTDTLNLTPAIDYKFTDNTTAGLYYTYSTTSGLDGYDLDAHTFGLNFRYNF